MSGPTPITAPDRLTLLYTVDGLQHKCQGRCQTIVIGGPSPYTLFGYGGLGNPAVQDAADAFFTAIAAFYNTAWSTFDGWVLEQYVSGSYVFTAADVTSVTPTGGGAESVATGWCVSGKSADNRNFPAYLYEGNFRALEKVSGYSALNTNEKKVNDYFYRIGGTPDINDAANWRCSRGESKANRWLASVWDSNQKLRRIRGIA